MRPTAPMFPRLTRRSSILSQPSGRRSEPLAKNATVVLSRRGATTFDDLGHGILAQPHLAPDQAIAAPLCDKGEHPRGEPIRFRPLSRLAAQALAARLGCGDTGADTLLDQFAFELGDAGEHD